ncbi:hypothetical protein [Clavibacter zhangzhiyongii]|uniref:hypothetical protein n=1 Tax=Clavibacter zhangzhiyongii TaxID=2768071 RepID=UPI002E2E0DE2|nr:hypothetical protein [Clavibacter zhangzhiyongii]
MVASTVITGCSATPPTVPAPTPAPSPSLTQEQQDTLAFERLYAGYVSLSFDSETEGDLQSFLTGDALDSDTADLRRSRQAGQRIVGKDTYSGFQVTDRGTDPKGTNYMTAQACLDVSGTRVLDASGQDATPARDDRLSLQMKAIRISGDSWRISDFVRNEDVHACG